MKLRWLCIFLLVCLMSGSGIADDSDGLNTLNSQSNSMCGNQYATNTELCGEAESASVLFQRCLDDPALCNPNNWGQIQKHVDTDEQSHAYDAGTQKVITAAEDMNEQLQAMYDAAHGAVMAAAENADWSDPATAGIAMFEVAYATCGDPDIALVVTMTLLDTRYQQGRLSEEELKGTVNSVFWEAFWEEFVAIFDEEMIAGINELLADDSFWEAFDAEMNAAINELLADDSFWEGFDAETNTAINELLTDDSFWVAFWDSCIATILENDTFMETSEETEMDTMHTDEEIEVVLGTHELSDAAYKAGIEVAREADWTKPDAAGREIFEVAYSACGDQDIALQVTLNLLATLYQEGSLSEKMLEGAGYAALLERLGEKFWEAYNAGIKAAQEIDWTKPDTAGREMFEVAYAACEDQDIALEVTLGLLEALYQEGSLSGEELVSARYAILGEKFGENAIAAYSEGVKGAGEVDWTEPDTTVREMFEAAYAACENPYIALDVTLDLLDILYQEGKLSEEEWENAASTAFWEQLLLVSLPFMVQT